MAHELGHVLGLDHVGASGAVMAFRYDERHPGLTEGDVVGAQRIYGLPRFLRRDRPAVNLVSAPARSPARSWPANRLRGLAPRASQGA